MSPEPLPCPEPPDWRVPWETLEARFEGPFPRGTCEALAAMPAWRTLPPEERSVVFTAALLLGGGEVPARQVLWRLGIPLHTREHIASAVRFHPLPVLALGRDDCQLRVFEASQSVRCEYLALLAEADARGQDGAESRRLLEEVELFRAWCSEQGCLEGPRRFGSDHARFEYFHRPGGDPDYLPHEAFRCEVVLMSGLPGAGKDSWIQTHLPDWPVVSLDGLRERLGVSPSEGPGAVVAQAREEAREHLRKGRAFVWNATNLTRQVRARCIHLLREYGARIRIVYVEASEERLLRQNRERPARVPEAVIRRYLERWTVPDRTEAHQVDWFEPR